MTLSTQFKEIIPSTTSGWINLIGCLSLLIAAIVVAFTKGDNELVKTFLAYSVIFGGVNTVTSTALKAVKEVSQSKVATAAINQNSQPSAKDLQ